MRSRTILAVALPALLVLLALSLASLAGLVTDPARFDRYRWWFFGFNILLLGVLFVLIMINVVGLVRKRLRKQTGSSLTAKMTAVLVLLVLVPTATLYLFSTWLVTKSVDSWFDVKIEAALNDALDLSRYSLDTQLEQYQRMVKPIADELNDTPDELLSYVLSSYLKQSGASEMMVIRNNQTVVTSISTGDASLLPDLPHAEVLDQTSQGQPYLGIDAIVDSGLFARLVFPLNQPGAETETRLFQVLYPMSDRVNTLATNVQKAYREYDSLFYLREALKTMLVIVLTLVLLSGVLYAVWLAFYASESLMHPIVMLTKATRDVGSGKLDVQIDMPSQDDLGQLIDSFNQMTSRLSRAHNINEENQRLIKNKNARLNTILSGISSGVLSLDEELGIQTANPAAGKILGVQFSELLGHKLRPDDNNVALNNLCKYLLPLLEKNRTEWKHELGLFIRDEYKTLILHGAIMPSGGYVIVFNDVTETIQANRETAWEEAARRMAHEIKNPLTPIQLAAERLHGKLSSKLDDTDAMFLQRCTHTISEQVQSMQKMVDEFSQYAHSFPSELVPLEINTIVRDVCELYRSAAFAIEFDPGTENPLISGDTARLRQLLHNLLKNAAEALTGKNGARVRIATRVRYTPLAVVEVNISDNGPGFDKNMVERIFEPYVSSKTRGHGLGLAIVKKITEEHNGKIRVANLAEGGAMVSVMLPCLNTEPVSRIAGGNFA